MKKILTIAFIIGVIIITVSCDVDNPIPIAHEDEIIENVEVLEIDDISLKTLKEKITKTEEKVYELFSNDFEGEIVSIQGVQVVKYVGKNNTFADVCDGLNEYCTPNVADVLIRKANFLNDDGDIWFITSMGEGTFDEFEENNMEIISFDDNKAEVKITRFYELGGEHSKEYIYIFQIEENGNIIISDLKEIETSN